MAGLTISAAVFGIIGGALKVGCSLKEVITTTIDAPDSVGAVMLTMDETKTIAAELYKFLETTQDSERNSIISLESFRQLEETIVGMIICLSKIEKKLAFCLGKNKGEIKGFKRAKWAYHEGDIETLRKRLKHHKVSISTLLLINNRTAKFCLAEQATRDRVIRIRKTIENDPDLQTHLQKRASICLGIMPDSLNTNINAHPSEYDGNCDSKSEDCATISLVSADENTKPEPTNPKIIVQEDDLTTDKGDYRISQYDFREVLNASRLYRNMRAGGLRESFVSYEGSQRGVTYSIFSRQSIITISDIAVYNLPISRSDIHNSDWYQFGDSENTDQTQVPDRAKNIYSPSLMPIRENAPDIVTAPTANPKISDCPTIQSSSQIDIRRSGSSPLDRNLHFCYPKNSFLDEAKLLNPVNPYFIKREEIASRILAATGAAGSVRTPVITLWGGLGCGKTELALDFLDRAPHVPAGEKIHRILIHAGRSHKIYDGLSDFARKAGLVPGNRSPGDNQMEAKATWNWLSKTDNYWILVLDDVTELPCLPEFTSLSNPRGVVVLTTRLKPKEEDTTTIEIGLFTKDQAAAAAGKYYQNHDESLATTDIDESLLTFVGGGDLLPIEIRAFLKYAAKKKISLGELSNSSTRRLVRQKYTVRDGYRIQTHGLLGKTPLYEAMWSEFERRDRNWDIGMDSRSIQGLWSTETPELLSHGILADVTTLSCSRCIDPKSLTLVDEYINMVYLRYCQKNREWGPLDGGNVPPVLAPDISDRNSSTIPKLARASYILRMSFEKRFYTICIISSFFRNALEWGTDIDNSRFYYWSRFYISKKKYFCHIKTLVREFISFPPAEPFSPSDVFSYLELITALSVALDCAQDDQDRSTLLELISGTLKTTLDAITGRSLNKPRILTKETIEFIREAADSLKTISSKESKKGGLDAAVTWGEAARCYYKTLCTYHQIFVGNEQPPPTQCKFPILFKLGRNDIAGLNDKSN
ncbi:hypothetical protein TWF730_003734 [Orbilia blumenaviensis]|uniref:NB-ARC domain-containing protein n=1 Tax=Orbilia blumenaviensis TaxID=1796055 RepID=A0AAV9U3R2_9PEZI